MAPSFGRSISFPLSPARPKPRTLPCHVRSISLPCRSHPLLSHLQAQIGAVRSWLQQPSTSASAGLAHIHALHAALADLLLLPDPQDTLRRANAAAADRLLDAFLLLADAHRSFQETVLALRQDVADAQAALRRRDSARIASAVRSQRRAEKELSRLAAAVSSAAKCARLGLGGSAEETEMAGALMEAAAASAAASAAVFSAAAFMSSSASSCKRTAAFASFAKKAAPETAEVALERLEELEQSIIECESGSEKVFRSIVQTRVSLLNIRTPAICI